MWMWERQRARSVLFRWELCICCLRHFHGSSRRLRQSITLPEMIVWWLAFPLLVLGLWYSIRHRLREVSPIVMFTTMLTLAYSLFQGNVGTAYRQRSQLLVFYFIFVAVGAIIMKERAEDKRRQQQLAKQELAELQAARVVARRKRANPANPVTS